MKLPLLPGGSAALKIAQADGIVGGTVWPAARALCEHLVEQELHQQNDETAACCCTNVVELGSGTGAVGLFAAAASAFASHHHCWRVTLTEHQPPIQAVLSSVPYNVDGSLDTTLMHTNDDDDETAPTPQRTSDRLLRLIQENLDRNRSMFLDDEKSLPRIMELDWTKPWHAEQVVASTIRDGNHGFDILLGSDVTYCSNLHDSLAQTMVRLMRPEDDVQHHIAPPPRCILAHQQRVLNWWKGGQDHQLIRFEKAANRVGLQIFQRYDRAVRDDHGKTHQVAILELRRSLA